jgi:hypothetical protein
MECRQSHSSMELQCMSRRSFTGSNHTYASGLAGPIPGQRNSRVDEQIRMTERDPVVRWIEPSGILVRRIEAHTAEHRTYFPDVRADHKIGT